MIRMMRPPQPATPREPPAAREPAHETTSQRLQRELIRRGLSPQEAYEELHGRDDSYSAGTGRRWCWEDD